MLIVFALSACVHAAPVLNEIRTGQVSDDVDEYFELAGDPGESLSGYWYVVIGDGETFNAGVVEMVLDLSGLSIGADGFLSVGEDPSIPCGEIDVVVVGELNFEDSDNVTHMLVDGFTGTVFDDLDIDDDGVLDTEPWTDVTDCIGLIETPLSGEPIYCGDEVGPDGAFQVTHAVRCTTGWGIGNFMICDLDTPGAPNDPACEVPNEPMSWGAVKAFYR
jgi:hypothetical protein